TLDKRILLNLPSQSPKEGIKLANINAQTERGIPIKAIKGERNLILVAIQLRPIKGNRKITLQTKLIVKIKIEPTIGMLPIIPNREVVIGVKTSVIIEIIEISNLIIL